MSRSHAPTIAAPFVRRGQSASQRQPSSPPGHEAQALARLDPVFEHVEQGEPGSREQSEQDAARSPARLPSLLAGALLAWFLLARHVEFRQGLELTVSGHSLLNASPN